MNKMKNVYESLADKLNKVSAAEFVDIENVRITGGGAF